MKEGREGLGAISGVGRARRTPGGERQAARQQPGGEGKGLSHGRRPRNCRQICLGTAKSQTGIGENEGQLKLHEEAYNNNVAKIKHASKKLADVREKITKYDAELKMSRAEAEMAKLATSFNFDVTTDFGQIEAVINDKISLNRAKVRVAADLSSEGLEDVKHEQAMEKVMADQALKEFEIQAGLVTPDTVGIQARPRNSVRPKRRKTPKPREEFTG